MKICASKNRSITREVIVGPHEGVTMFCLDTVRSWMTHGFRAYRSVNDIQTP
uniref:Uncharacterized protein n=1 Tax=Solanum tuberosum TaxID=4113 RepID=M1C3Y3_SOLTU